VDLAYVLGEAHGLAQICNDQNQTWRSRMLRLVEVETPEEAFRLQLFNSFNTASLPPRRAIRAAAAAPAPRPRKWRFAAGTWRG
jgi:uncharacterized protein (TIGR02301 family)